ncbi:hypothetical protein, conserved [Plasmodium gonderi]|uniref:C2 domain-containing protein n=1 Tax=Plasmodium gonderi TaxID=77519 RepID=A0A1Y1JKB2_PLAGO|nr:hypothetical protein, conserved [Plasmodium gonderi]GAW80873.1 hypothetical protein, conserved [Plasmodium gonderi]
MVLYGGSYGNNKIAHFSKSSILEKGTHLVNVKDDKSLKEYRWWNGLIKPKETFNEKKTKGFLVVKLFLYAYLNRISTYRSNKDHDLMYPYLKILLNDEEIYRTKVLHSSLNIWEEKIDIEVHYVKSKIEIQLYELDETEGIVEDEYIGSAFIDVSHLQLSKKYDIIIKYINKVGHLVDPYFYKKKTQDEQNKGNNKVVEYGDGGNNNICTNSINDSSAPRLEKSSKDYSIRIFAKLVSKKNYNNFVFKLNCISSLNYSYVHNKNEILDKELNVNKLYEELKAIKGNIETIWLPFFSIIYNFASWKTPLYSIFFVIFFFFSFFFSKFFFSFFLVALSLIFFILVSIIRESDKLKRNGEIRILGNTVRSPNLHSHTLEEEKKNKSFTYWMQAKTFGGYCQPKEYLNESTLKDDDYSGSISERNGSYTSCSLDDVSTENSSRTSYDCRSDARTGSSLSAYRDCSSVREVQKKGRLQEKGGINESGDKKGKSKMHIENSEQSQEGKNRSENKENKKNTKQNVIKNDNKKVNNSLKKTQNKNEPMDSNTTNMSGRLSKGGKTMRQSNNNFMSEINTDDNSSSINVTEEEYNSDQDAENNLSIIKTFVSNVIDDDIINNVKYFHYILFCFSKWSQILFYVLRKFGYFLVVITLLLCFLNIYFYPLVAKFLRFSIFVSGFILLTYNFKPTNIFYRFFICIHEYYYCDINNTKIDIFSVSHALREKL